jgi:hypothetical protein
LTVAPILALHDELLSITPCESRLRLICHIVFFGLYGYEPRSTGLQESLESLNDVLEPTMEKVDDILLHLNAVHKNDPGFRVVPDPITNEDLRFLFNPKWQYGS